MNTQNEMNLKELEPLVLELESLKTKYSNLKIQNNTDKTGYEIVKSAVKELASKRIMVTKIAKDLRDGANKFAKAVIAKEKELLCIVEPLELLLSEQVKHFDNVAKLPERLEKLKQIDIETVDGLEKMTDVEFNKYLQNATSAYIERKKQEEALKIAQLQREKEIEEVKKIAIENAKIELEKEKNAEIERLKKEIEQKKIDEERKKQKEIDDKLIAEQAQIRQKKEELENLKYQNWLKELKFNSLTDKLETENEGKIVKLYRLVAKFTK